MDHLCEALRSTYQSNLSRVDDALFCNNLNKCDDIKHTICQTVQYCNKEWMVLNISEEFGCDHGEVVQLNCSDQFGLATTDNGIVCLPLCEKFSFFGESFTTAYIILTGIANGVNIVGGVVVVIVSIRKRKKM